MDLTGIHSFPERRFVIYREGTSPPDELVTRLTEEPEDVGTAPAEAVFPDPRTAASSEDTGAETLQRYRYQAAFAAWLAIGTLEEIPGICAVYCEHHDDVLLDLDDGRCDAVQVKSQESGIAPLKGTAKPVLGALRRFIELEHVFGERFRFYRLASISGFHRTGTSASNLDLCLQLARTCSAESSAPIAPLSTLIKKLAIGERVDGSTVVRALAKVELDGTLPKLQDIEARVRRAIENLPEVADYRPSEIAAAAETVVDLAAVAGRATEGTAASEYVRYLANPDAHAARAAIEAKRLTPQRVREVILAAASRAAALRSATGSDVASLPEGTSTAHKKYDAGGLPIHTVTLLDDLRASAEFEIDQRLYRDGAERTNSDYDHIQVLVRTLAEDARLAARAGGPPYGQEMLEALRQRLSERARADPRETRGLTPEQMTGVAAILTELCKVWWSEEFDLNGAS